MNDVQTKTGRPLWWTEQHANVFLRLREVERRDGERANRALSSERRQERDREIHAPAK